MMFWRSVVGKLWITILLLVSFVLFILTIMLLEFFQNYHINEMEKGLTTTAQKIATTLDEHDKDVGLEISWELLDSSTKIVIIENEKEYHFSPYQSQGFKLPLSYLREDNDLKKVFSLDNTVSKMLSLPDSENASGREKKILLIGAPLKNSTHEHGGVFIYQSLDVVEETTRTTTKYIFLAAGVAIILTTIFAFFLSTRITAPLRKMREAAFEVARGKFDTKVPFPSQDEIGELAIAFNQMGKQLKFNMNALQQEKEQLSNILSAMADGVITFNKDGVIMITNPPAERFLNYWYYEHGDVNRSETVPTRMMELLKLAVATEKEQIGEISIQGRFWVMIISPLYNNQYIRGAVVVIRDMTDERQLDKLRQDFIANVSHELRTPISMMQGYSEAIVDDIASTDEEKREMAKIIYDESLRMGRLVNELLDLARMEAGHVQVNLEEVEIQSFLRRIARKFQNLASEKDIDLQLKIQEEDSTVNFDPDAIEQVLTNLIDNAIRHTPESGSVIISEYMNEKGLIIRVTDSGTGIPEEDLPFVFERFYKADKARTRGRSGTGLGLAIAKNIIQAHKGEISVQSKIGQGTTFTFFIPRNID
jgi:two-component system, OmpR family, sensor histidine kinase ResE